MIYPVAAHGKRWVIEADPRSRMAQDLALRRPYEAGLLEHIYGLGPKGYAIDVGASIGNHTLYFVRACGMPVIAFEPLFFDELEANIERNRTVGRWVEAHKVALGAEKGKAKVKGKKSEGKLELAEGGRTKVERLDSFNVPKPVALIKIDVEGMEADVLDGARETIEADHPMVFVEAATKAAKDAQSKILKDLGYKVNPKLGPKATSTRVYRWDYAGS